MCVNKIDERYPVLLPLSFGRLELVDVPLIWSDHLLVQSLLRLVVALGWSTRVGVDMEPHQAF